MTSARPSTSSPRADQGRMRERLRLARDLNDVGAAMDVEVRSLAFDRWTYEQLQPPLGATRSIRLGSDIMTADGDLAVSDLLSAPTFKTTRPFISSAASPLRTSMDSASDHDADVSGNVPIHGPAGSIANLSVYKDGPAEAFQRLFELNSDALLLMALEAHQRIVELTQRSGDAATTLSDRQLQVLRWTIRGKTNWEIGRLLGITEDTVRQHMIKICQVLGATNRTQAAVIAVSTGLLAP